MDTGSLDSDFSEYKSLDVTESLFDGQVLVTGLTPGLTYRFYSTAVNMIGESDQSIEVLFSAASLVNKPATIRKHTDSNRS